MPTTCTLRSIAIAAASSGVWKSGPGKHVEADIAEGRGDDLGAAIVPVLAELGDATRGAAPVPAGWLKRSDQRLVFRLVAIGRGRRRRAPPRFGPVVAEGTPHRLGDLADRSAGARRPTAEDIAPPLRATRQFVERGLDRWIALAADALKPPPPAPAHRVIVDGQDLEVVIIVRPVFVDADNHLVAAVDSRLLRVAASSISRLGSPSLTALVMPPCASTSSIAPRPSSASSLVRLST